MVLVSGFLCLLFSIYVLFIPFAVPGIGSALRLIVSRLRGSFRGRVELSYTGAG